MMLTVLTACKSIEGPMLSGLKPLPVVNQMGCVLCTLTVQLSTCCSLQCVRAQAWALTHPFRRANKHWYSKLHSCICEVQIMITPTRQEAQARSSISFCPAYVFI